MRPVNKLITVLIFLILLLTIAFSYKTREHRFSFVKELKKAVNIIENKKTEKIDIINRPIIFDAQRKYLTATYREKHTGDCDYKSKGVEECIRIEPKLIILHMTEIKNLEASFEHMKEPVLSEEREKLISRSYDRLNVSAHYLIDRDGSIYNLMPEYYMARHAIGVNHNSIGIENVGTNKEGPSQEQIESAKKLVTYLMKKYGIPLNNVYSHAGTKVLKESNNPLFVEKDTSYFEQKYCGEKILTAVKEGLSEEGY
jgi:beta-N-acetylhexosaminidase